MSEQLDTPLTKQTYSEIAQGYAEDVVSGRILAGKFTKLACQRNLNDWDTEDEDAFEYVWDTDKAEHACQFVELLPLVKATGAGKLIHLEPWQVWIVANTFAWVEKAGPRKGKRRFSRAYLEIPRKNGKSSLSSAIALYMLLCDGEEGADVYSAAVTRDQAAIVFEDAQKMARHRLCRGLMDNLGVTVNAHSITQMETSSRFRALSADSSSLDGLNTHLAVVDELHAHPNDKVYNVLLTSTAAREQSLIWVITTAGFDLEGVCYAQRKYLVEILEGSVSDDNVFGCIWSADEDDDPFEESTWIKANPNWGVSVIPAKFMSVMRQAKAIPSGRNHFLTKYLNLWQNGDSTWAHMPSWRAAHKPELQLSDFNGKKCFIGLDLASKSDLCAMSLLFPDRNANGKQTFTCFTEFWLPEEAVNGLRHPKYPEWYEAGLIWQHDGNTVDYDLIEERLCEHMKAFDVQEIAYDPWQAEQLAQHMVKLRAPMIEIGQNVKNISAPTKELDALVREGRFQFDNNVLMWCASNVVVKEDHNDNIYPRKLRKADKIDGVSATINALSRIMFSNPVVSPYATRGLRTLG